MSQRAASYNDRLSQTLGLGGWRGARKVVIWTGGTQPPLSRRVISGFHVSHLPLKMFAFPIARVALGGKIRVPWLLKSSRKKKIQKKTSRPEIGGSNYSAVTGHLIKPTCFGLHPGHRGGLQQKCQSSNKTIKSLSPSLGARAESGPVFAKRVDLKRLQVRRGAPVSTCAATLKQNKTLKNKCTPRLGLAGLAG